MMMKKSIFTILIAILAFASCSKDSPLLSAKMTATIDGKSWSSLISPVTVLTSNRFIITGTSLSGEILIVEINGDAVGTYNTNTTTIQCMATYKGSLTTTTTDAYVSALGKVNLTQVDKTNKKISGTFEFTLIRNLTETKTVSAGSFTNLSYTEQ